MAKLSFAERVSLITPDIKSLLRSVSFKNCLRKMCINFHEYASVPQNSLKKMYPIDATWKEQLLKFADILVKLKLTNGTLIRHMRRNLRMQAQAPMYICRYICAFISVMLLGDCANVGLEFCEFFDIYNYINSARTLHFDAAYFLEFDDFIDLLQLCGAKSWTESWGGDAGDNIILNIVGKCPEKRFYDYISLYWNEYMVAHGYDPLSKTAFCNMIRYSEDQTL